jgi:hypothetical protein
MPAVDLGGDDALVVHPSGFLEYQPHHAWPITSSPTRTHPSVSASGSIPVTARPEDGSRLTVSNSSRLANPTGIA